MKLSPLAEIKRDELAEKEQARIFSLNPGGFTVAPYCNSETLAQCYADGFSAGYAFANQEKAPLTDRLEEAAERMRLQSYGKDHNWVGSWTFCTNADCVRKNYNQNSSYAYGGNWLGNEIECPECELTKALAEYRQGSSDE